MIPSKIAYQLDDVAWQTFLDEITLKKMYDALPHLRLRHSDDLCFALRFVNACCKSKQDTIGYP